MNGTELMDRVAAELADTSHDRWARDDLAHFITWSQAWVAAMRPDVLATHELVALAAGAQQSLSALVTDGWRIVRGSRNKNGRTLQTVYKDELDRILPDDWMTMSSGVAYYLAVDRVDHDRFWVWPPAASSDEIELLVAKRPSDVTTSNESNEIDLPEYVREPIVDYALGIALRRNTSTASIEYASQLQTRAEQMLARILPLPNEGQQQAQERPQ